ncbi:DUF4232 domain-containing protein [Amycolatopsis sp. PS_44_ISF1]|uniref:DUF4232 domain-containing protein n=1 Tax=Amycolatopsis sp. PS_44_ISF1 TaxID=2974917 RepID=UPI0028DF97C7|nr:DUF4232 domain-containing protein [Amycolatopsis sp. PS_44_ISF1]MDT8911963.1 DUF4232 domain-containing protein [Amycolatopsis sp. PS_44_ISF1]
MNTKLKTLASITVAGGIAAGGLLLTGGAASAMPSDTPCGSGDVVVTVTPDQSHSAGQEAFVLNYTAANPTTNCKLEGVPTAVTFTRGHGEGDASNTVVTPDRTDGSPAQPVNLRAGHPAESRILQDSAAPATFQPTVVNLNLPTGPNGDSTTVAWPADAPLKGTTAEVTDVASTDAA